MPWSPKSFTLRHNKRLTPKQAARASAIANDVLRRTGDEGLAVRTANGVVRTSGGKKRG
jgi:hypothetical protein